MNQQLRADADRIVRESIAAVLPDAAVRRALSNAIGRTEIAETAFAGRAQAAVTPFHPLWKPVVEMKGFSTGENLTQAVAELEAAGYNTKSGSAPSKNTKALTLELIYPTGNDFRKTTAELLTQQLAKANITLEGKVTITATAGKDNVAIGANGIEQEFSGLAEGSSITRYDSEGIDTSLPGDKVPVTPVVPDDTSSGGSADASVQESVFPGLVVTDKDGQRISYTSTQSGNTLTVCVGRFMASLRISLATLRQLRA